MQSKNKNYFDEKKFQALLKIYQSETTVAEDGKTIITTNKDVQKQLVKEVEKIINAIIMVYRYWIFEDYDDLKQHALQACFTNFMKLCIVKIFNTFVCSAVDVSFFCDKNRGYMI